MLPPSYKVSVFCAFSLNIIIKSEMTDYQT